MRLGGYEIDIIVCGYPGKSVYHGTLGWSAIVMMRKDGRIGLGARGAGAHAGPPRLRARGRGA